MEKIEVRISKKGIEKMPGLGSFLIVLFCFVFSVCACYLSSTERLRERNLYKMI